MLFTIFYALILIALILFAINPNLLKKVAIKTLIAITAVVLIAGLLAIPGIVRAEVDVSYAIVDITYIEAANHILIVHFDYDGQDLAFEWYGSIDIKPLFITVVLDDNNYNVVFANYYTEERYGRFFE